MASLANFKFTIKYQWGKNNAMADALRQFNESLNVKEVKAILDGISEGCQEWAELPQVVTELGEVENMV